MLKYSIALNGILTGYFEVTKSKQGYPSSYLFVRAMEAFPRLIQPAEVRNFDLMRTVQGLEAKVKSGCLLQPLMMDAKYIECL